MSPKIEINIASQRLSHIPIEKGFIILHTRRVPVTAMKWYAAYSHIIGSIMTMKAPVSDFTSMPAIKEQTLSAGTVPHEENKQSYGLPYA